VMAGHPGIARTAAHVARFFYWPGLHADVAHFVRTCLTCAAVKPSNSLRMGSEEHAFSSAPAQPFSHWAMDLVGPLPLSRAGNAYIVTWVDRTTKMIGAQSSTTSAADLAHLNVPRYLLPVWVAREADTRQRCAFRVRVVEGAVEVGGD
jgi:hypothetical protein